MQVVTIEVTNRCTLNCPSCFVSKESRDMSLSEFEQVLTALPDETQAITLTGGDPFILLDLFSYCEMCSNRFNVKPSIFTSGCLNPEHIPRLAGIIKKIHVTIKYPNHLDDIWKGKKGSFDKSIAFLKLCKEHSIPTYINCVVDKTNLLYLGINQGTSDMLNLAVECKSKLLVLPFIPYDKRYERNKIPYNFYCRYFDSMKKINPLVNLGVECDICKAGVTRMNISVAGEVSPCIYLPHLTFGNIFEENLEDIIAKMHEWRETKGVCGCIAQEQ